MIRGWTSKFRHCASNLLSQRQNRAGRNLLFLSKILSRRRRILGGDRVISKWWSTKKNCFFRSEKAPFLNLSSNLDVTSETFSSLLHLEDNCTVKLVLAG